MCSGSIRKADIAAVTCGHFGLLPLLTASANFLEIFIDDRRTMWYNFYPQKNTAYSAYGVVQVSTGMWNKDKRAVAHSPR